MSAFVLMPDSIKTDYGFMVYETARLFTLKILNPIHHQGLGLSTGAFRSSPVLILYAENNEYPLEKRPFYLGFQYTLRLRSVPRHLIQEIYLDSRYETTFRNKPPVIPPFTQRIKTNSQTYGLDFLTPVAQVFPTVAPWERIAATINFSLTKYNKRVTPVAVLNQEFSRVAETYSNRRYAKCTAPSSNAPRTTPAIFFSASNLRPAGRIALAIVAIVEKVRCRRIVVSRYVVSEEARIPTGTRYVSAFCFLCSFCCTCIFFMIKRAYTYIRTWRGHVNSFCTEPSRFIVEWFLE